MDQVSRRDVMRVLAVGAAAGAASGGAALAGPNRGPMKGSLSADSAAEAARALLRGTAPMPSLGRGASTSLAEARLGVSWDDRVFLVLADGRHGVVTLTEQGRAIALACQAAGRQVAARVWGHDAGWGGGVGRFEGAVVALEIEDLPRAVDG